MPTIKIEFADRVIEQERSARHIASAHYASLVIDQTTDEEIALLISKHPTTLDVQINKYRNAIEAGEYAVMFAENIYR
jgi:hypothetical protein